MNAYITWLRSLDDLREPLRSAVDREWQSRCAQTDGRQLPAVSTGVRRAADELITAGYRALTKRSHPDVGGRHEDMIAITDAREWLRQLTEAGV